MFQLYCDTSGYGQYNHFQLDMENEISYLFIIIYHLLIDFII